MSTVRSMVWREFPTQVALRKAIQERVNPQPFDIPFADELISDLIVERHYFCSLRGLRPTSFKKTCKYSPYLFWGLFDHGWHPVSWDSCLSSPPSRKDIIVQALRDRTLPIKTAFRISNPVCVQCQSAPSQEVHHADPTFEAIIERITTKMTDGDFNLALSTWDWFKLAQFSLPDDLKLVIAFDEAHRSAKLEALCRKCHNRTKSSRKKATPSAEDMEKLVKDLI